MFLAAAFLLALLSIGAALGLHVLQIRVKVGRGRCQGPWLRSGSTTAGPGCRAGQFVRFKIQLLGCPARQGRASLSIRCLNCHFARGMVELQLQPPGLEPEQGLQA